MSDASELRDRKEAKMTPREKWERDVRVAQRAYEACMRSGSEIQQKEEKARLDALLKAEPKKSREAAG